MPNTANTCGGNPSSAAICSGKFAHCTNVDATQAERLRSDQRALRRQRRVHHADNELLDIMRAIDLRLAFRRDPVESRQVGQPHQQQRCVADELLLPCQLGEA